MTLEEIIAETVRREIRPLVERIERLNTASGDELLTIAEAGRVAKVKPATIRRWIREGHLEARGKAKGRRVSRAELLGLRHEPKPRDESTSDAVARMLGGG
jgi:hypothetical protein